MYDFMYIDTQKLSVEVHFTTTKTFVVDNNKMSTPVTASKHCLEFSYISSEDHELGQHFDNI